MIAEVTYYGSAGPSFEVKKEKKKIPTSRPLFFQDVTEKTHTHTHVHAQTHTHTQHTHIYFIFRHTLIYDADSLSRCIGAPNGFAGRHDSTRLRRNKLLEMLLHHYMTITQIQLTRFDTSSPGPSAATPAHQRASTMDNGAAQEPP